MTVDVSVVVAVYNEDPRNLSLLLKRLKQTLMSLNVLWEIVFVNDGSNAETSHALSRIAYEFDFVKLVVLSRNFGQQAAISAGIDFAEGEVVINLDSDLQDPPELISEMVKYWRLGYQVVYAQRSTRRDRLVKRLAAYVFYRILGLVSVVKIPWDTGDFRLVDRKVIKALAQMPEKTRFLRGQIPWLGFKQIGIPVDREARAQGESTYTVKKLLLLAIDGLLSFSVTPLYMVPILGFGIFVLGIICLVTTAIGSVSVATLKTLLNNNMTIIAILTAFSGLQITCLGIVAVYLCKVLDEVRSRPTYLISEVIDKHAKEAQALEKDPTAKNIAVSASQSAFGGGKPGDFMTSPETTNIQAPAESPR